MMTLRFRPWTPRPAVGWIIAAAMILAMLAAGVRAEGPAAPSTNEPIEITADKLVTDNKARSAEFSGNVRAVQGKTEITADRLLIFYQDGGGQPQAIASGNIERMQAYGTVRIVFDNKVAVSDQAVYITSERKLVLEGPGSKVISGKDQVEGSKITFYRNDGRVALEGNKGNRVRAIIHSGQRGLN